MKITILKRTNKEGDKQTIRFIYWYGSRKDADGKRVHDRKREQFDLNAKTKPEKHERNEILQLGLRPLDQNALPRPQCGQHGFTNTIKIQANCYGFFNQVMETKKTNES